MFAIGFFILSAIGSLVGEIQCVEAWIMGTYIMPAAAGAIVLKMDISVTERPLADALKS